MAYVPNNEGGSKFAGAFTNMVIAWNHVEDQARGLLTSSTTGRGSLGSFVAIHSLGNVALTNALEAIAEHQSDAVKGHLDHFIKCMNRFRAYRNYYVHSLTAIGSTGDGKSGGGMLQGWEVKGSINHVQDYIRGSELEDLATRLEELRLYALRLNWALRNRSGYAFQKAAAEMDSEPWPEKPPLPKTLAKRRRGLQEFFARAQSSQA